MNKDEVIDLIKDAGFGFLATVDKDSPKVRPMMPLLDDSGNLLLAVLAHSRTIEHVKANPKVEICYVDRKMSFARIAGKAKVNDDREKKELVFNMIPMLRQYFSGPDDSNYILLEIESDSVEAMTPQQKEPDILSLK